MKLSSPCLPSTAPALKRHARPRHTADPYSQPPHRRSGGRPDAQCTRRISRIARGAVTDLALIDTLELDALILPGGYGAAKNLSDYAFKGAECSLNPDVAHAIRSFHTAGKPIGFICIAPALAAQVLGAEHPPLTIGNDPSTAEDLEKMGARHVDCPVWNAIVWNEGKVVSTPAYMLGPSIAEVAKGIDRLVEELARLL